MKRLCFVRELSFMLAENQDPWSFIKDIFIVQVDSLSFMCPLCVLVITI